MTDDARLRFGMGGTPGTEFLPDDLPPEDAEEIVALARLVLEAALYPNVLPPDPLPAPLELALAIVANRIWKLSETEGAGALPVISESIGSYSYRLATPGGAEATLILSDAILGLIEPWLPVGAGGAYELHTGRTPLGWPLDWWQRDLDNDFPNFLGPLYR